MGTELWPVECWYDGDHFVLTNEQWETVCDRIEASRAERPCPGVAERIVRDVAVPVGEGDGS
jgi:hypothetical protein